MGGSSDEAMTLVHRRNGQAKRPGLSTSHSHCFDALFALEHSVLLLLAKSEPSMFPHSLYSRNLAVGGDWGGQQALVALSSCIFS